MFGKVRRKLSELRSHTSGNATLLVAIGMPALIGGSGLAVDVSQYYMWKRDMQYAVDQAALAGAWARTNQNTSVQDTYATRATQEYDANISMVGDFDVAPTVTLAAYGAGQTTNNSVKVTVTAAKKLPFTNFVTGNTTTVYAEAQATYTSSASWSVCIFATHPTMSKAFKFGGSVSGSTTCGVGTLSNDPTAAMFEAGNTDNDLGNLIATGGIDNSFSNNGYNRMHPNTSGLSDPYAGMSAPSSAGSASRTYACSAGTPAVPASGGTTVTTATTSTRTVVTYDYKKGQNAQNYTTYTFANDDKVASKGWLADTDNASSPVVLNLQTVPDTTTNGSVSQTGPTPSGYAKVGSANGQDQIWRQSTTTVYVTYSNVVPKGTGGTPGTPAVPPTATLQPGIYSGIAITCATVFNPGVYFISGSLDFGQNQTVTQTSGTNGVLFVFTGSAGSISINSNSVVALKGITQDQLTTGYSMTTADAAKLAGTLIFDKDSTSSLTINGNSDVKLDGLIYTPKRDVKMNGNGSSAGVCMMVAGSSVEFLGNFNIDNICKPSNSNGNINIGGTTQTVKLVV